MFLFIVTIAAGCPGEKPIVGTSLRPTQLRPDIVTTRGGSSLCYYTAPSRSALAFPWTLKTSSILANTNPSRLALVTRGICSAQQENLSHERHDAQSSALSPWLEFFASISLDYFRAI